MVRYQPSVSPAVATSAPADATPPPPREPDDATPALPRPKFAGGPAAVEPANPASLREWWRLYHEQGLQVFPLKRAGKNPGTDFGIKWRTDWLDRRRPTYPDLLDVYETGVYGLWLATGQVSKRVVLDLDSQAAHDFWRTRLTPAVFDAAPRVLASVKPGGFQSMHLHFLVSEDDDRPWASHSDNTLGYDFRGDGGGVVMPPSVHKSGAEYRWGNPDAVLFAAPDALRKSASGASGGAGGGGGVSGPAGRGGSTLAAELSLDPSDPGRGNNWLAKVAGFEARQESAFKDRYLARMRNYNWASEQPIPEDQFMKTVESIWRSEQNKKDDGLSNPDNGWLVGNGERILCHAAQASKEGGDKVITVRDWADFDIKVRSVNVAANRRQTYIIDLITTHGVISELEMDPVMFGQESRLTSWLAGFGASILPPEGDVRAHASTRVRLQRYVKAQERRLSHTVPHLGWSSEANGFVTHQGLFTSEGLRSHDLIVPHANLVNQIKYNYGVEADGATAIDVLREVLTHQDEQVTSVFGAWWVMAMLKGQYPASVFPFMSIEAPSESGKTTGFFAEMVALSGNVTGHGQSTFAAQRDVIAGHRNGIAWIDDVTDVTKIQDLLRQATSEGTISLRDVEGGGNTDRTLVSPVFISGEGSGTMMAEKAMRDRSIRLAITSPKGRVSRHDATRPQWDDVLELMSRFGGTTAGVLNKVSGSLLIEILNRAPMLDQLNELRPATGRHGDKMGIVRMGARILADLTGDHTHVERVDRWVGAEDQQDEGNANVALREIVPWALNDRGMPTSASGFAPAYYDEKTGSVMVHIQSLSDAWLSRPRISDRQRQFGAPAAIISELDNNGVPGDGKNRNIAAPGGGKTMRRYRMLPPALSAQVIDWAGSDISAS